MRDPQNIKKLSLLQPDIMGFIFAKESPRYIELDFETTDLINQLQCEKAGVFVNEEVDRILELVEKLDLDYVQLHGDETPEMIDQLKPYVKTIKAFSVDDRFYFDIDEYENADYFLFDTKGRSRGGNGIVFNWSLMNRYHGKVPFLLSGGIRLSHARNIKRINHPQFLGIDINSGFEIAPGLKNIDIIAQLKLELDEVYC